MKDITSTTLLNETLKRITEGYKFGWSDELTVDALRFYFQASAKFLAVHKSKDKPVALELRDYNGGFHFAMVAQFMTQSEVDVARKMVTNWGSLALIFVNNPTPEIVELAGDFPLNDYIQFEENSLVLLEVKNRFPGTNNLDSKKDIEKNIKNEVDILCDKVFSLIIIS